MPHVCHGCYLKFGQETKSDWMAANLNINVLAAFSLISQAARCSPQVFFSFFPLSLSLSFEQIVNSMFFFSESGSRRLGNKVEFILIIYVFRPIQFKLSYRKRWSYKEEEEIVKREEMFWISKMIYCFVCDFNTSYKHIFLKLKNDSLKSARIDCSYYAKRLCGREWSAI